MDLILRAIWLRCIGQQPAPGWDWDVAHVGYYPGRILCTSADGDVWEITARRLSPDDPQVVQLAASIAAIDSGDVE